MSASSSSASLTEPAASPTVVGVLRMPEVLPTLAASVLARMPFGAMGLLTILRLTDAGYSYGQAGLTAASYAVAVALGQPILSRVIDRDGQTRVLLATAVTGASATSLLALLPGSSPLALFLLVAAVTGLLQPPLAGAMRALWDLLLTRPEDRHVGYAVEASAVEVVFTGGPLVLVGIVAATFGPQAGLLACAAMTGSGTVAFALSAPSRRWRPAKREYHPLGPLRSPGVLTALVISVGAGANFGSIEIAVTAFGRERGALGLVAVMLAIWAVGSFVGGMIIARVPPAADPPRRIAGLLVTMGVLSALVAVAETPWLLAPLLALAGGSIAPIFATTNGVLGQVAPPGTITEAFGWVSSAVMVGLTIGSPGSGYVIDHVSTNAAFLFSGAPLVLSATVVWLARRTLRPQPADGPALGEPVLPN